MKRLLFVAPVLVFALLAVALYAGLFRGPPSALPSPLIGKPAPEIAARPFDGAPSFSRGELGQGRPAIINFWASWCAPCRVEAPVLKDMAERRGLTIYGVVYKDEPAKARAFLTELGNPFAKIVDDPEGRVGIDWGVTAVPETFVIDGKGIVRVRYAGALTDQVVRDIILPALRS